MPKAPLLPFADYQRIYQVIYSVLQASEVARTHRACFFFASVGAMILRDRYGLEATFSAGNMALMVDSQASSVLFYGRMEEGVMVHDAKAFHAWTECDGWLIDFMSPIIGEALREDGHTMHVPRRMLQKPLALQKQTPTDLVATGDYFVSHDKALTEALLEDQPMLYGDLLHICMKWFRKPPKLLEAMGMGGSHGDSVVLKARAPAIEGVW